MKFFFDNNLSPRLSRALNELEGQHGHDVIHLKEKFDQKTADEEWITKLGSEGGWVVVTSDYRITKNPHEVLAWQESGLTVFFLRRAWTRVDFWQQAWQIVKRWPDITKIAERNPTNARYLVPIKGSRFEPV
jgi:hypothetical protein